MLRPLLNPVARDRRSVPDQSVARPVRDHGTAIDDPQGLNDQTVDPIHVFEEMAGRRLYQQMRAGIPEKVWGHLDVSVRRWRRWVAPTRDAAEPPEAVRHATL